MVDSGTEPTEEPDVSEAVARSVEKLKARRKQKKSEYVDVEVSVAMPGGDPMTGTVKVPKDWTKPDARPAVRAAAGEMIARLAAGFLFSRIGR